MFLEQTSQFHVVNVDNGQADPYFEIELGPSIVCCSNTISLYNKLLYPARLVRYSKHTYS